MTQTNKNLKLAPYSSSTEALRSQINFKRVYATTSDRGVLSLCSYREFSALERVFIMFFFFTLLFITSFQINLGFLGLPETLF